MALAAAPASAFTLYTVGSDAACSFSTIQQAIDAATDADGNSILIAQDGIYDAQHLVINGQNINLLGGLAQCDSTSYIGQTTITGGAGHSVIEIEGSSQIYISGLEISGASMDATHQGGGIYFGGSGTLTVAGTWIHGNQTGYGGGIAMNPSAISTLNLVGSVVSINTALVQGGGIRLAGPVTMFSDAGTYITGNSALGQGDLAAGGGIELVAPAVANISSSINNNSAGYGGGIAGFSSDQGVATINLYTTDPATPVSIYGNHATEGGGGVYLESSADSGAPTVLCARDFAIDANTALFGTAIDATENGAPVTTFLNAESDDCYIPLSAVACAGGTACNEISDNVSQDRNQSPSDGATVSQSYGPIAMNRVAMRRNHGGSAVYSFSPDTARALEFHDDLFADNVFTDFVIEAVVGSAGSQMIVDTSTFANNVVGGGYTLYADVNFAEVTNSIIADPGAFVMDYEGPSPDDLTTYYDLVNNAAGLVGDGIIAGPPTFVDAPNGDYHLLRTSLGVDFAPDAGGLDMDGNPRGVDLTDVPNQFGPMDLGAYEIQTQPVSGCSAVDGIFCNGFDG